MYTTILAVSTLLAAPFAFGAVIANSELPPGARCRQDIRAVDDQADTDMRDVKRLIDLLEEEMGDHAIASSGQDMQERLRVRLAAAKTRRADILDKQHDDLNVIRARCDRSKEAERNAASADAASSQ